MKLTYGNGNTCDVTGTDVVTVRAESIATIAEQNIAAQVQQAFANPLDYPDLAKATVPGDTVAIVVQHDTPRLLPVITGTMEALDRAGVEKSSITILLAPEFATDLVSQQSLRELVREEVAILVHASDNEEQLSLLGVTEAGRPLRLNRVISDADLVIPIGPARGSRGTQIGMVFPTFSDQETIGKYYSPSSHETTTSRQKLAEEIRECDWMLGVGLALQVLPGPRGEISGLYCGTPSAVTNAARLGFRDVWSVNVASKADLVVATLVGDESQQTWENLKRALVIADDLLAPGGAIAVCSAIAKQPGPSGKRLRDAQDLAEVERKLMKDAFADSVASLLICRLLQRGTIYLKSQLKGSLVESLGFAPIESNQELERLINRYQRCLLLEEAQFLEPQLVEV